MADCILHEPAIISQFCQKALTHPGRRACEVSPVLYGTVTGHVFNVALKGCWHSAYMPVY